MRFRRSVGMAALAVAIAGGHAQAQTAAENRDADMLAADMRILAANPLDIEALITAGELTLKMGDNTAAAGFFTRAEKLDPLNPRIKAGWGTLMVRAERPGEALRRFQEAQQRGLDPRKFAADRGLAYDLIGEQERAQRDYRLVLRDGPNDEVTRRYALSLGISGKRDEAMKLLDPLLRRSDRAAWRDRAFIMAMTGDPEGAQKIANTMMSPGLGAGLAPFFQRLPMLSPADRAFAVTFGELRSTPERLADARLVPPLPQLGPDPYAPKPVELAAAAPARSPADEGNSGKRKKRKRKDDDLAPAVPAAAPPPPPVEVAMNPPAYRPPPSPPPAPMIQPLPGPKPTPKPTPTPPPRVAMSMPPVTTKPAPAPTPAPAPLPPPVRVEPAAPAVVAAAPPPPAVLTLAPPPPPSPPVETEASVSDQPSPAEAGVAPTATARAGEDRVLANIIAGINVPGSELGVAPMPAKAAPSPPPPPPPPPPAPPPPPPSPVIKPDPVQPKAVAKPTPRGRPTRDAVPDDGSAALTGKPGAKGAAKSDATGKGGKTDTAGSKPGKATKDKPDEVALDKNGCPLPAKGKAGAKGAATAAKSKSAATTRGKASDARCKTADKDKTDTSTKGEPARIWVQVAGGANESTLLKAWNALRDKAPDLFRGRQGWTTPLRNTNRVLTGPFKSNAEAQAFVNQLSKAGITGFVFTSDKGQKIDRLGSK